MKNRRYFSGLGTVLLVLVLCWAAYRMTHPVSTGVLQMSCSQLPTDDSGLAQWLASQPLVTSSTVTRTNGMLVISYKRSAADAGEFAPALVEASKQRGYDVKSYTVSFNKSPFQ